jgi:hypothetical protein
MKKKELPKVDDITKYVLQLRRDGNSKRMVPVKNTYVHKDTGEVVKIDWRDGAFRLI